MSGKSEHCRRKAILSKHFVMAGCAGPTQRQAFKNLTIRMVAGFVDVAERKEILVAGARNHPNCLVLPFSLELIRLAAWACTRD
jgi:hypothetical protein